MNDEKKDQTKDRGADVGAALAPDPSKSGGVMPQDAAGPGDAKGESKPRKPVPRRDYPKAGPGGLGFEDKDAGKDGGKDGGKDEKAGRKQARGEVTPAQYEGDGYGDVPVQMRGE